MPYVTMGDVLTAPRSGWIPGMTLGVDGLAGNPFKKILDKVKDKVKQVTKTVKKVHEVNRILSPLGPIFLIKKVIDKKKSSGSSGGGGGSASSISEGAIVSPSIVTVPGQYYPPPANYPVPNYGVVPNADYGLPPNYYQDTASIVPPPAGSPYYPQTPWGSGVPEEQMSDGSEDWWEGDPEDYADADAVADDGLGFDFGSAFSDAGDMASSAAAKAAGGGIAAGASMVGVAETPKVTAAGSGSGGFDFAPILSAVVAGGASIASVIAQGQAAVKVAKLNLSAANEQARQAAALRSQIPNYQASAPGGGGVPSWAWVAAAAAAGLLIMKAIR